jgi:hypothetical protein
MTCDIVTPREKACSSDPDHSFLASVWVEPVHRFEASIYKGHLDWGVIE